MKSAGIAVVFSLLKSTEGAQLLEFALSLPFLLVMVVGICDFGLAYNLKQKMNNASREGVRFAETLNQADAGVSGSATNQAIENDIVQYLIGAGVDVCGLKGTESASAGPDGYASWTYTSPSGCSGGNQSFTIEVDRSHNVAASGGGTIVTTRIILTRPYVWWFNSVIGLLSPGSSYSASTISTSAIMGN